MIEKIVYMLRNTGDYEAHDIGPYWGAAGLDFDVLADQYRSAAYAAAQATQEDYCGLSDSEFITWLIQTGILSPLPCVQNSFTLDNYGEHRYIPAHWPACPQCGDGRGEPEYRNHRKDLNRVEKFAKCTHCSHEWGAHDVANVSSQPMLDDDGRYTEKGCVPYAISQATGLSFAEVMAVCAARGWSEHDGMHVSAAISAAAQLGYALAPRACGTDVTLARMLRFLSPTKRYIVSTGNHWLAVVDGDNRDRAGTHGRRIVHACWEVLPLAALAGRAA